MSVLEQVTDMKNQGIPEEEIIKKLQDQGIAPKAINDALNQTQIKEAVNNESDEFVGYERSQTQTPSQPGMIQTQELPEEGVYAPQPQEEYSTQDYAPYQEESAYSPGVDTNTVIEISEQVFSEKIDKIQKQVDESSEFKILVESKIENISQRIKRIENVVDRLQAAILEKIGSYGSNLESIKKEMTMMQDSFGKVINPLTERAERKHPTQSQTTKTYVKRKPKTTKKK